MNFVPSIYSSNFRGIRRKRITGVSVVGLSSDTTVITADRDNITADGGGFLLTADSMNYSADRNITSDNT